MIFLTILVVLVAYSGLCTLVGLAPSTTPLAGFSPEVGPLTRTFGQPQPDVLNAYFAAAKATPGMTVRETATDSMLIDLRPTSRILGGNFGLSIRVRTATTPSGTRVTTDAKKKVAMAFLSKDHSALVHVERSLRMNAKRLGLTEVLHEPRP
jgi:hypothetical protein